MRTFIAVELPEAFKDEVAGVARQLSAAIDARYAPRANYHITLAFLGDITEAQLRSAIGVLEEAAQGLCSFPLRPDGIGKFGKSHNATLWMGVAKAPELMSLTENLREGLHAEGVPMDGKAFLPHITLARHATIPKAELPRLLFPQEASARKVTIFKSTLLKAGAEYKPLYTVEL